MAILKKVSNYGSRGKCIPLTKDIRDLFEITDFVLIEFVGESLIIKPVKDKKLLKKVT